MQKFILVLLVALFLPKNLPAQPFVAPRVFFSDANSVVHARVKDPSVVRFRGKYWMYYSAWLSESKITVGIATSENLLDWKPVALLPLEGSLEAKGVAAPGALVLGGKIHLFYQSYEGGPRDAILHAWSEDGIHFTRDGSNPIFRPTGSWTSGRAIDAEARVVGTNLFLYCATRDASSATQEVALASAPLASEWSRTDWVQLSVNAPMLAPQVPTTLDAAAGLSATNLAWEGKCIEAPTLFRHGGFYYLFYAGNYNNAPQQIGVAVSTDGKNFRRMFNGHPILKRGEAGAWNHSESGHPGAFQDADGNDYLFFQGDNTDIKLDWRISLMRVKWKTVGTGQPDEPVLESIPSEKNKKAALFPLRDALMRL